MKKRLFVYLLFICSYNLFAQVGIRTTDPKATLDIVANNSANPDNNEGLLIPRISVFPTTNPTINQQGMLVYLTTNVGVNNPGFYYWNNPTTSWINIEGAVRSFIADGDGDTKIQVEENADEDIIRFDLAGTEKLRLNGGRMEFVNTNSNIFIGESSGENYVTGLSNIGLGRNSLKNFINGNDNISIGHAAFENATSASYNIGIGWRAGYNQSGGNKNVLLGYLAGAGTAAHSKSNNTMLGYQAGHINEGNANVFLGYQAGMNEISSNKLYIDNSNTISPLIYGEFDTNILRVNGTLDINNAYQLPTIDGAVGQVLTTDGVGNVIWNNDLSGTDNQNISGSGLSGTDLTIGIVGGAAEIIDLSTLQNGLFEMTSNVVKPNTTINNTTTDFVFGADQLDDDGNTNHDNRFFFDKSKGAFRAGMVDNDIWNNTKRGEFSAAFGKYSEASGEGSMAWGVDGTAKGDYATAFGGGGIAEGDFSTAWGSTSVYGEFGTGWGSLNSSDGDYATVWGQYNTTYGSHSTAFGFNNRASSAYETVLGVYSINTIANSQTSWDANDRLFTIGNGTSNVTRSNALTIYKNGTMNINDAYNMPTSDGSIGQVMSTDGSGVVSWNTPSIGMDDQNISGSSLSGTDLIIGIEGGTSETIDVSSLKDGLFELVGNVVRTNSPVSNLTSDFVFGSPQLDYSGNTDHLTRFFFDKSKGAFRAGRSTGSSWNNANVGDYSVALGYWPTASGFGSFAVGGLSKAEGYKSMAIGDAVRSFGDYATAMGRNNFSYSYGEFVTGMYATTYVANDISNWNASDRLFVVGNGSSFVDRSNGLTIYKNGTININDAYNMPIVDGGSGEVLTTDGSGNTSWETTVPDSIEAETTSIAFEATWNHYGGTWEQVTYYKDRDRIYLDGLTLKNASIGTNDHILTLPVGYRPAGKVIATGQQVQDVLRIEIHSDGKVYAKDYSGTSPVNYISLSGISFRVN